MLARQLEQTAILTAAPVKTALMDLGYRSREIDGIHVLHRGKPKSISKVEKRALKRRRAVRPGVSTSIPNTRCTATAQRGGRGDAMYPILAAAVLNLC